MSKTTAFRDALPFGAPPYETSYGLPVFQFSNPFKPSEQYVLPCYHKITHPCTFHTWPGYNDDKIGSLRWGEYAPPNGYEYDDPSYTGYSTDIRYSPLWDGTRGQWSWDGTGFTSITPPHTTTRIYLWYLWGPEYSGLSDVYEAVNYSSFLVQFHTGALAGVTRRIAHYGWVDDEYLNPDGEMDLYYIDFDQPLPFPPSPSDTIDVLFDVYRYNSVIIQLAGSIVLSATLPAARDPSYDWPTPIQVLLADMPPGDPPTRPSIYYADEYYPVKDSDRRFTVPSYIVNSKGVEGTNTTNYVQPFKRNAASQYTVIPGSRYIVDVQGALGLKVRGYVQRAFSDVWGAAV